MSIIHTDNPRIYSQTLRVLACISWGLELWLFTWGRMAFGPYASPLIFVLAGLMLGGCALFLPSIALESEGERFHIRSVGVTMLSVAAGIGLIIGNLRVLLVQFALNINYSDIIPAIRVYTRRWLWGSTVYRPLTNELGYLALPTYLPSTWFSFIMAEYFNFDYRWLATGWLLIGIIAYWGWLIWLQRWWPEIILKALLPLFVVYSALQTEPAAFGLTVESMIGGFYLLLGAALLTRSLGLRAVALTLCLLSRYALVLWVPVLLFLIGWQEGRRRLLQFCLLVGALVVICYGWPVWRHDPLLQVRVQAAYDQVAVSEWQHIRTATGLPYHTFNGLGMAPFFYPAKMEAVRIAEAVRSIKQFQLLLLGFVTGGTILGWWWYDRRHKPSARQARWVAVVSLKLYLVVFYGFLQVPYAYLTMVSVVFSLILLLFIPLPKLRMRKAPALT